MIYTDLRKPDLWNFTNTAKAMNGTQTGGAAVAAASGSDLRAVTLTLNAHGFSAGSLIFLAGTTNYNGLRKIHAVATNTITILAEYVAETVAGTYFCGMTYASPFLFLGLKLHLSAAATTDEDFEVSIDSDVASTHDTKIYDHSMAGVQDIIYTPATPVLCGVSDIIKCTWTNTDARNWGLTLIGAPLV